MFRYALDTENYQKLSAFWELLSTRGTVVAYCGTPLASGCSIGTGWVLWRQELLLELGISCSITLFLIVVIWDFQKEIISHWYGIGEKLHPACEEVHPSGPLGKPIWSARSESRHSSFGEWFAVKARYHQSTKDSWKLCRFWGNKIVQKEQADCWHSAHRPHFWKHGCGK